MKALDNKKIRLVLDNKIIMVKDLARGNFINLIACVCKHRVLKHTIYN